jgi:hypothetical protein
MAEAFIRTIKRDYVRVGLCRDAACGPYPTITPAL